MGLVDEKMKQELGLSIDSGVRISGVLPGMGADVAGLKSDDVIFSINERELKTFQDFEKAIRGKIAGDVVEVVLYRGSEKLNMPMTLTGRQAPALPATAQILAEEATKVYKAIDAELDAIFEGVSEEQADARPEPDEWSAKETLAHLIYTERWLHIAISCFLDNQHTGGFYNDLGQLAAMADAYTLEALIAEIKLCEVITVATVAALPESFMADKRRLLQLVQNVNEHGFALHTRSHFPQIEAALEAARISTRE